MGVGWAQADVDYLPLLLSRLFLFIVIVYVPDVCVEVWTSAVVCLWRPVEDCGISSLLPHLGEFQGPDPVVRT